MNQAAHILLQILTGKLLIDENWLMSNLDTVMRLQEGKPVAGYGLRIDLTTPDGEPVATMAVGKDGSLMAEPGSASKAKTSLVATVSYIGPVYKYGWYSGSKIVGSVLRQLSSESSVSSVRLILDSPGGEVAGTRELHQTVAGFQKPLLVVADGLMASAAYYIGAGGQRIVATQPTDRIGSIGTMASLMNMEGLLKSWGIDIYNIYATESTEKHADVRRLFESKGKDDQAIVAYLDTINRQFLSDVRAARPGVKDESLRGAVYAATEAKERALIDDIVPLEDTPALLADLAKSSSTKSTHNMSIISKLKDFIQKEEAQQATESTEPTAEEKLTAIQAELAQAQADLQAKETELAQVKASLQAKETELASAQAELTTVTADRDSWKAKAEAYGRQPGEVPTNLQSQGNEIADEGEKSVRQVIDSLEAEQEAARLFPE